MLAKDVFRGIMQLQTLHRVVAGRYSEQLSQIAILPEAMSPGTILGLSISLFAVLRIESFKDTLQHCSPKLFLFIPGW